MPWHPAVPATPYSKAPAYSTPRRESAARTPPKATGGPAWHIAKAGHRSRLLRLWRRSGVAGCRRRSRRRWLPRRKERVRWRWLWSLVSSTERCSRSMVPTEDPPPDLVVAQLSRRRLAGLGSGAGRNAPFTGLQHIAWQPSIQNKCRAPSLSIFREVYESLDASIRAAGRFDMPTHRPTCSCTPGPRNFSALHDVTSGALRYEYDHSVLSHVTFGRETLRNSNAHD